MYGNCSVVYCIRKQLLYNTYLFKYFFNIFTIYYIHIFLFIFLYITHLTRRSNKKPLQSPYFVLTYTYIMSLQYLIYCTYPKKTTLSLYLPHILLPLFLAITVKCSSVSFWLALWQYSSIVLCSSVYVVPFKSIFFVGGYINHVGQFLG